ncbi:hypothetical protein QL285_009228 [Trifolium repens]|nr:hypothetical protein QL285_009228 [Trifolium repens]
MENEWHKPLNEEALDNQSHLLHGLLLVLNANMGLCWFAKSSENDKPINLAISAAFVEQEEVFLRLANTLSAAMLIFQFTLPLSLNILPLSSYTCRN